MDARNAVLIPELSHTVQAKDAGGRSLNCTPNVIYPRDNVMCLTPWDHESYRVYDTGGVFHTIFHGGKEAGMMHDSVVYAIQMDGSSKADTVSDKTPTLTVPDKQSKVMAVVTENPVEGGVAMFENHAHDSRYTGPLTVSQTVSQLFGTGGNNTPLIVEVKA